MTKEKIVGLCDKGTASFLYLLIFCLPFSKSIVEISFVVCLILWLVKNALLNKGCLRRYLPSTVLNPYIFIFVIVCVISATFSEYPYMSFRALISKTLEYITLFFIIVDTINSEQRFKRFITVLTVSFVVVGIDAVWQYVSGKDFLRRHPLYSPYNKRLRACFSGAVGFAGWLSGVSFIIAGYLFSKKRRATNILASAVCVIFILLLASTSTRAAMVSVVLTLLVFAPFILKSMAAVHLRTKLIVGILVSLLLCGGLLHVFRYPAKRGPLDIITAQDVSTRNRVLLWKQAVAMIRDRPLVGWGLNTYTKITPHYEVFEKGYYYPHNSILHVAIELGLAGVIAFFAIIARWFAHCILFLKQREDLVMLGIGMSAFSFLLQSFFDAHLYSINLAALCWIILALGISYGGITAKQGRLDKKL